MTAYQAGLGTGKFLDLSAGTRFESPPKYQLSSLRFVLVFVSESLQANIGKLSRLDHDRFFPNSFNFEGFFLLGCNAA
jgi:hypothetical protein